jgi:hypothetical protein
VRLIIPAGRVHVGADAALPLKMLTSQELGPATATDGVVWLVADVSTPPTADAETDDAPTELR